MAYQDLMRPSLWGNQVTVFLDSVCLCRDAVQRGGGVDIVLRVNLKVELDTVAWILRHWPTLHMLEHP